MKECIYFDYLMYLYLHGLQSWLRRILKQKLFEYINCGTWHKVNKENFSMFLLSYYMYVFRGRITE